MNEQPAPSQEAIPVAFVSSHAARGGSESYLLLVLEQLGRDWIRTVVSLQDGPFVEDLRAAGHPVVVLDTGGRLAAILVSALRLRRVLRGSGARLVHANGVKGAVVASLATTGSRIPVVWFKHDVSRDGRLARLLARRCARVVAVSSAVTTTFSSGRGAGMIDVLPYQLPEPRVDQAAARRLVLEALGAEEPVSVVALVGRLDAFKGHAEVLAVAPGLLAREPKTRILFVGGPDPAHPGKEAALRSEIAQRGLEGKVVLTGYRSDALELIAGSDALVVPSFVKAGMGAEAGPWVALEALALGTPVVGYDQGGLPEHVGNCGLLVPPGDRAALEAALLRVIEDVALRVELSSCGRQRFRERFLLRTLGADLKRQYYAAAPGARR